MRGGVESARGEGREGTPREKKIRGKIRGSAGRGRAGISYG